MTFNVGVSGGFMNIDISHFGFLDVALEFVVTLLFALSIVFIGQSLVPSVLNVLL